MYGPGAPYGGGGGAYGGKGRYTGGAGAGGSAGAALRGCPAGGSVDPGGGVHDSWYMLGGALPGVAGGKGSGVCDEPAGGGVCAQPAPDQRRIPRIRPDRRA